MIVSAFLVGMLVGFYVCFFALFLRVLRIAKNAVATSNECIAYLEKIEKEYKALIGWHEPRPSGKERIH